MYVNGLSAGDSVTWEKSSFHIGEINFRAVFKLLPEKLFTLYVHLEGNLKGNFEKIFLPLGKSEIFAKIYPRRRKK